MSNAPLRVLFLTRYPVEGASSRYRVFQYLPYLQSMGVECTTQSFMDRRLYDLSFAPGRTFEKAWGTLKACWRRIRTVLHHHDYDAVYMQRELLPFGPPLLERWMKRRGAVLFFDYDDALFIKKPSRYNPLATLLRAPGKVLEVFRIVDCVVAGNDWLRDQAQAHGARRAETIEVAEDVARIPLRDGGDDAGTVTIGWLGSTSTVKYLREIEPALREIATRHPEANFEIVGGGDFRMQDVPWRLSEWSLDGEVEALRRFDIGLMPLPMEDWAKGKSGGKARTYMAAGVVPVCTAIGYNMELIEHGRTGFLCTHEQEWIDCLERLIADPGLRGQIAAKARREVEMRFNPEGQAMKLRDVIASTVGGRA